MVGRLSLPADVPELSDSKRRAERGLDSPDSGLPPSPGPGGWLHSGGGSERGVANALPEPLPKDTTSSLSQLLPSCTLRLCPLSFCEGVAFDPLPPKDIRYTSSIKYDSEKHFINNISMPMGLGLSSCSQTIVCVPGSTWRSYKAEVRFEPRPRPRSFASTTIIYPKLPKTVYTTTLDYNCRKFVRKFLSSVELESTGNDNDPDDC
ncbi:refilin-B [Rhineura floridana]|uniref:refilin-B n=1 Tax=Rhineura floridana TaxID=261503 RepID=UPI002AC8021B|nr:refilin-B [Rhineura floridana]